MNSAPQASETLLESFKTASESEAIVEPDPMADDFAGKAVVFVTLGV